MSDEARLSAILQRRNEFQETERQRQDAVKRAAEERAAKRLRVEGLWELRIAELELELNKLNADIRASNLHLRMTRKADPSRSPTVAQINVDHHGSYGVIPHWYLAASVNEDSQVSASVFSIEGKKGKKIQFDAGEAASEHWRDMLIEYLDVTVK